MGFNHKSSRILRTVFSPVLVIVPMAASIEASKLYKVQWQVRNHIMYYGIITPLDIMSDNMPGEPFIASYVMHLLM
jgi:hypothetical protein